MRFPAIVLTFSTQLFFVFVFWRERYNRFWLNAFIELFQRMRILVFELPVKQPVTKGGSRIHVCLKEMKICIVIHDRTARPLTVQTDATTPNIVAPTMLRVSVVWKRMQQLLTKQHAITCNRLSKRTQRVTSNNVASVCKGPYLKCRYSKAPCKRTQHCWVHVASVCPPSLTFACCCFLLLKVWNRSNF